MNTSVLKRDQERESLDDMYRSGYYNYLENYQYHKHFLEVVGRFPNYNSCLDVGCGTGQLAYHMPESVRYLGFDASQHAINLARKRLGHLGNLQFEVARLEELDRIARWGRFELVVFGGILHYLVNPEFHLKIVQDYIGCCKPAYLAIYDLQRLDTRPFDQAFNRVLSYQKTIHIPGLERAKCQRKIAIYRC